MKTLKYTYYYVLQGNYRHGWDDLVIYDKKEPDAYKEAKQDLKDYRANETANFRIIERKVKRV